MWYMENGKGGSVNIESVNITKLKYPCIICQKIDLVKRLLNNRKIIKFWYKYI